MGNESDPLELIKKMWGGMGVNLPGMNLPNMITPTLDVDELDRRIRDLKTVEGWLQTNLSMLQMTIQGLDVHRNALAMVNTMTSVAQGQAADAADAGGAHPFANLWSWPLGGMMKAPAADEQTAPDAPASQAQTSSAPKTPAKPAGKKPGKSGG